jgi:signal transduction histidine kinase
MKWKLREKVLLLSILTALIPFITVNVYWYFTAQNTVRKNAEQTITLATSQAADKVNDFLNTKLIGFLSHSQNAALLTGDTNIIREDLLHLLLQDPDLLEVAFVDEKGMERVKIDRQHLYRDDELKDVSQSDAFKLASFQYGKEYISPVSFNDTPQLTIAVPVTYPEDAQSLRTFSSGTTDPRPVDEVRGVLISTIKLDQLIDKLLSLQVGQSGYVYLADRNGRLIGYHDKKLIGAVITNSGTELTRKVPAAEDAKNAPLQPEKLSSLEGFPVLSTQQKIERTNWFIITEMPIMDISEDISIIQQRALFLSLIPVSILMLLSMFFARNLINPITYLVKGTQNIAKGNFDFNFKPIHTGDELEQLATAYSDMAQKIKVEQHSLVAEKNTLSTVLSSIVDGVVALDEDYRLVFLNHAASMILGINESQSVGRAIDEVISFRQDSEDILIKTLAREQSDSAKVHKLDFITTGTQTKAVNLIISSIPPSFVTKIRYLLTFYDVSKEQELETMKLDFVSMAAHELRTPLTAIKGYLSYLHELLGNKLNEEETMFLSRVVISSDQLSSLIENLLNVTKIERGILKLDLAPFQIDQLIEEALVNLREVGSQKQTTIDFDKPNVFPSIMGDQFRIRQVFTNLVSNAINYSNPGSKIKVSLERRPDSVTVHVSDNGQGIPESALPHLFTKFYRVGGALEQGSKGTGLGLFISKSIIDRHNGKIWVESVEGKGSTFSFMLPIQTI